MSNVNNVTVTGRIVHIFETSSGCIVTLYSNKNHPKFICFRKEAEDILQHYSVGMFITLNGFVVCSSRGNNGKVEQCIFCREVLPTPTDRLPFRNEFVFEGQVTSICQAGHFSKIALFVDDDGHTAILNINVLTKDIVNVELGDHITVVGSVTTKRKDKDGIRHFYQNFIGLHVQVNK